MAAVYNISYTDPLKTGFTIQPGSFNGPGGSVASSTLRLYGRGAIEWGEAVDEDLLRITETFAGSTSPRHPIAGQLWFKTKFFWHDTTQSSLNGWYLYDPNLKTWGLINTTGTVLGVQPPAPTIGMYWFDGTLLNVWASAYQQEAAAWLPRSFSSGAGTPTATPAQTLHVFDAYANSGAGEWVAPVSINVSPISPITPQRGAEWFNTTTGILSLWSGTAWQAILGPSSGSASPVSSDLDMQNAHRVINMPNPANPGDAVSYGFLVAQIGSVPLAQVYLPLAGGTIINNLTINGTTFPTILHVTGAATFDTGLTSSSTINLSNNKIQSLAAGTVGTDAVNLTQMNTSISTAISALGFSSSNVPIINPANPKNGDMQFNGSTIQIFAYGSWRQIWPATYS